MSIAFVQQKAEQSTTAVSSFTTSAFTPTAGNALAVASSANLACTLVATDSVGDSFLTKVNQASPLFEVAQWDLALAITGGSTTVTVTPNTAVFISIAAHEYSGVGTAPVEATANNGYSEGALGSQLPNPGPISPPSLSDLHVSAWTHSGSGSETFTPSSGWTLRANLTNTAKMPLGTEDIVASFTQTGSATLSGSAAPRWEAVAMALRAADQPTPDANGGMQFVAVDFPAGSRGFL